MYTINYVEDGRFITTIGGPVRTIAECQAQINKLTENTARAQLNSIIGCRWERNGVTCSLYVIDDFGFPISIKEQEDA